MPAASPLPVVGPKRERGDGTFLWETIANGPVRSRRLGVSLGLNLLPARSKVCSFNCPYCHCGFNTDRAPGSRWPSPDEVAHSLQRALERLPEPPAWITFSGNGEPTLHPRFPVVVDRVLAMRDATAPGTRVGILSNGLLAGEPRIRAALLRLEGRMMKLDPGPPELVNGMALDRAALVESCRALKPYTVQAMVVRGWGFDGASAECVAEWVEWLVGADPDGVQLYSLDGAPADPRIATVPRERLDAMATEVRRALPRARVEVF